MKLKLLALPFTFAAILLMPIPNYSVANAFPDSVADEDTVPASPKAGWALPIPPQSDSQPWWAQVLLWVPNRFLDFVDIFRVDVGVGPSFGAVVRVTDFGQLGYRQMLPASLRIGDFGRQSPFVLETSNEFGAGPMYVHSSDRTVCTGEVGLGADVLIVGAYGGVCLDEFVDFVAGVFFIDLKDDDL